MMAVEVAMSEDLLNDLADLAAESESTVYVVGGYVRDRLLGREPVDIDLLVEGNPAPFLAALSHKAKFEPVVFSRKEPVTYRVAMGEWLIDVSACRPGGLREAVSRRDFTINALAAPLKRPEPQARGGPPSSMDPLLDLVGGLHDMRAHRIHHITEEGLEEDPLRLLRAVRLAVILDGFTLDPALRGEIARRAPMIATIAPERILSEMEVILASSRAGAGLRMMVETDLLYLILPEMAPLEGLRQNRWHRYDALEHTIRTVEEADRLQAGTSPYLSIERLGLEAAELLKWAALLHDVGKASTASAGEDGEIHFYGHETVSADLAADAVARLRMGSRKAERIRALIANHLRLTLLSASGPASDRVIRRLVHQMKLDTPLLCLLALADRRAGGGPDLEAQMGRLEHLAGRVMRAFHTEGERIISPPPLLTGHEVMEALGLQPGPPVGALLKWLTRLQVEDKIHTRDEALDRIRSLPPSRILTLEDDG